MAKNHASYTLLELTIILSISLIPILYARSTLVGFVYRQQAALSMQQIQLAITYARSEAVLHKTTVTICPSSNGHSCGHNWQDGILVATPFKQSFYTIYIGADSYLSLQQSGQSQGKLIIQANGMTYTNGHFNYRHLKSVDFPQFNLYFNKALRFYARPSE